MAKLRRNHQGASNPGAILAKGGIFALIVGVLYAIFQLFGTIDVDTSQHSIEQEIPKSNVLEHLPSSKGQIVHHNYYSLSYIEEFEQPEWVAYELTSKLISGKHVKRDDNFRPDPLVKTKSAALHDYKRSGYDRGHLVPAGDMNFNEMAMSETFFMSNMSPQVHNFNGGIWRELEEQTRDWVRKFKQLYIVSGPILTEKPLDYIGNNDVAVPGAYYKVLLHKGKNPRAIGFILNNEVSDKPLKNFMVSIDEVEARTGIDFFNGLMNEKEEERIESYLDKGPWTINNKRYTLRREKWNFN